jgi:L-threonylcarbamoyladenylate synthase
MCKQTLKISEQDDNSCKKTAEIIKNGGIAIVPTETVYAFAVNAFNIKSQKMLYRIKGRNLKRPLILMTNNIENIRFLVEISPKTLVIAEKFWPGQLTMILPTTTMGRIISGGRKDLGVRIPNNKFMLNLLNEIVIPIYTTSVNLSNKKSAKSVSEAIEFFDGVADVIVDGGRCMFSFESTVVDMIQFPYVIIRRGCLDISELSKYI